MKLTIFLWYLESGGTEKGRVRIGEELCRRGYDVDIVCIGEAKDVEKSEYRSNVHCLGAKRGLTSFPLIYRYLSNEKPDIILTALNELNIIPIISNSWAGDVPILASFHTNIGSSLSGSSMFTRPVIEYLLKNRLSEVAKVITVSKGNGQDLEEITGHLENMTVIHDPIIPSDIQNRGNEAIKHEWFRNDDIQVILGAAGKLIKAQDFPTLIRSFSKIQNDINGRLIILGEGPEREFLEKVIIENGLSEFVELPGFVDNPYPYFKNSDVFVLSSKWQALPNSMVESMAFGTPIVSTDCPSGPREILNDGELGQLVPIGAEEEMAEAIVTELENPTSKERLMKRAADFNIDKVIDEYEKTITEVCSGD